MNWQKTTVDGKNESVYGMFLRQFEVKIVTNRGDMIVINRRSHIFIIENFQIENKFTFVTIFVSAASNITNRFDHFLGISPIYHIGINQNRP